MGPGKFFLTQVGSAIFGLGMDLENFPWKCQIFQFFALRVKKNVIGSGRKVPRSELGWPLIYWGVNCMFGSGRVGSGPISNYRPYFGWDFEPFNVFITLDHRLVPRMEPLAVWVNQEKHFMLDWWFKSFESMIETCQKFLLRRVFNFCALQKSSGLLSKLLMDHKNLWKTWNEYGAFQAGS